MGFSEFGFKKPEDVRGAHSKPLQIDHLIGTEVQFCSLEYPLISTKRRRVRSIDDGYTCLQEEEPSPPEYVMDIPAAFSSIHHLKLWKW